MRFIVNNLLWTIKYVNPLSNHLIRSDGSRTVGCTDLTTQTVYLADNLSEDFERKVLCHEICHCYIMSYNIYLPIAEEERLCDFVATYGRDVIVTTDRIMRKLLAS